MEKKIPFVLAFSGGKDCMLALDHMLNEGHQPICLLMCMKEEDISHMHKVKKEVLMRYEEALGIPVVTYHTVNAHKEEDLLNALKKAKEMGAEAMVTGDIFMAWAHDWNEEVCKRAGMDLICPLWGKEPLDCINEVVQKGYMAIITGISGHSISNKFLGKTIDKETIEELKKYNVDITGENGEYHTMVVDGPIFKKPLPYQLGNILEKHNASIEIL